VRPLKLAVQGFTCFRQHTEVDFDQMELYAIQGPTGSGKSSLLDAIMYALYGQTPRLGKVGHDALISQGERALQISFEFECGDQRYRVARSRGRKQADNEVRFETWNGERYVALTETKKAETQAAIERAVGLTFDSFTRAVVLPQGQFDRFLRGSGRERQELLGALLNLEHYRRMAEIARDKVAALTAELRAKQALLDGEYAHLTADVIGAWRDECDAAERDAALHDTERARLTLVVQELTAVADTYAQLQSARSSLTDLQQHRADVETGMERARQARRVAAVLPLIATRDRARDALRRAEQDVARDQRAAAALAAAERDAGRDRAAAEEAAAALPELEARAEVLAEAERQLATLKRYGGDLRVTHPQPLAWDEDAYLSAREQAAQHQALAVEEQAIAAEEREIAAFRLRLAHDAENAEAWRAQLDAVMAEGKAVRARHDAAQEELRAARERLGADALRAHLHVGQPCPLCEQHVHALPATPPPDLAGIEQRAGVLDEQLNTLRDRLTELRANIKAADAAVTRDRSDLYRREEAVARRREQLESRRAALSADAAETATRYLAGLAAGLRVTGDNPARERRDLLQDMAARRQRLDAARQAEGRAASAHAAASAALAAAERTHHERHAEHGAAEAALREALAVLDLAEDAARAASLNEDAIVRLEEAAREWAARHERCQAVVIELEGKLLGRPYDPDALTEARAALARAESSLNAARRRAGELAEQVRAGEEKLARKQELEAGTARLSRTLDSWAALAQSLRANEFQQFLLAEIEADLLERAGELLFEISDGRYRLLLEQGEYSVQDLWNAGETRGVRTLSGGETFLASLALAIALSDYLAGNRVLGALFLDEGFGTLDPQALEAVAGALERVRTQGRMVGVITHVESLSERLPSRILVSKSVAGSRALRME